MKNTQLQKDLKKILATKNVIVEKNAVTKNAINVYVNDPVFEDIGTYPYYDRETDFKADFKELTELVKQPVTA